MKTLIVYKYKANNFIKRVEIDEKHTEEELYDALEKYNNENTYELSAELFFFEETDVYYNVLLFLLGKDKYKTAYTISNLIDKLDDIKKDIDDTSTEIDRIRWKVEDYCNDIKNLVKNE